MGTPANKPSLDTNEKASSASMAFSLISRARERARELVITRTYSFSKLNRYLRQLILFAYRFSSFHLNPFFAHLCYFLALALLGSLLLMVIKPSDPALSPRYVDMIFMSTSALTVSGLGTVETERLSSGQIFVLAALMFLGGDVFVTLLGLLLRERRLRAKLQKASDGRVEAVTAEVELGEVSRDVDPEGDIESSSTEHPTPAEAAGDSRSAAACVRYLGNVVAAYITTFHVVGVSLLLIYFHRVSSARDILRRKGINVFLFCLSTTISSFANGGLIATNENMAIFNRDPLVLLLMIGQVLAGNTLFPLFLRWVISVLKKVTGRQELGEMLKSTDEERFAPLKPKAQTKFVSLTVVGLLSAALVLFCALDWSRQVFDGLTGFEKFAAAFFIAANARHSGENSIDPSLISPAVLVLIIVMMYLPSSATFWPIHRQELEEEESSSDNRNIKKEKKKKKKKLQWVENLIASQLSYIFIFIIVVCIIERKKMYEDPLNFSAMNIIFEVTSGYGNVGLSVGYSCARLQVLHPDAVCTDRPVSHSGFWSDGAKLILAFVMLYGRLKVFSSGGGKAWKLY